MIPLINYIKIGKNRKEFCKYLIFCYTYCMNNSTNNYYNLNAHEYFNRTFDVQPEEIRKLFCSKLDTNSTILDIGCGSGRDSLYFKENGFHVIAIDASEELAKLASKVISQEVIVADIEHYQLENPVDGVWAMASLLHLPKDSFKKALINISNSLKPNGAFFMAVKVGDGESYDQNGRFFSYYQPEELAIILKESKLFQSFYFKITKDNLGRDDTEWLNVFATTKPQLNHNKKLKP